jgi:uncharacterized membrane protein HdeD (DUF308 family)
MKTTTTTQTVHPWRAALRTGGAIFIALLFALAAVGPLVVEFVGDQFPGSPAEAIVAGTVGFIVGLSVLVNRVALLPAVSALLTRVGLGPAPK